MAKPVFEIKEVWRVHIGHSDRFFSTKEAARVYYTGRPQAEPAKRAVALFVDGKVFHLASDTPIDLDIEKETRYRVLREQALAKLTSEEIRALDIPSAPAL